MPATTQTRVIKIVTKDLSSAPTQKIAKQMGNLNKNIKKTAKSSQAMAAGLGRLKGMFAGVFAALGVREITRSIDSFQLLKDRITSLWGASQNTQETFKKLIKVANDTNAPIATIADGFARMSISTKDAGHSVDETIAFVKALQQTLRLSGASVQESNSVFLQMGQAFGLTRLQGQELRAVMLGDAEAARILAKIFKTTKGNIRDFGEKGLLETKKIMMGFIKETKDLNERANMLRMTFGQGAVKIMNAFRVELDKLNTSFALTSTAADAVKFLVKHMRSLFIILTSLASSAIIAKMIAGIKGLVVVIEGLTVATAAATAAIVALGAGVAWLIFKERKALDLNERLAVIEEKRIYLRKEMSKITKRDGPGQFGRSTISAGDQQSLDFLQAQIDKLDEKESLERRAAKAAANRALNGGNKTPKVFAEFEKLNKAYEKGKITLKEYTELLKIQERAQLDLKLEKHKISVLAYKDSVRKLNEKFDKMLEKYEKIKNKDDIFEGIKKGAEDTIKSIGTVAEQIAGVTSKAFGHLEDSLVEFTKEGKINFRDFTTAILDDINRMVIRMSIIKPLAGAVSSYMGGGVTTATAQTAVTAQAKGGAWQGGNIIPFATGGVVGSPTSFGMSGGRTGIMGEDGPEAILPLSRGKGGKLGVMGSGTVVNIINNSSEVETETKSSTGSDGTEQIDVYIVNKVGQAIGDGQFDRPLQQLYGLNRKGQ